MQHEYNLLDCQTVPLSSTRQLQASNSSSTGPLKGRLGINQRSNMEVDQTLY